MNHSRGTRDEAERFASDVDSLLADQPVAETSDDAYQADLALVQLLSQGRFVPDPHFKCRLRNQLLNQLCEERKELKTMSPMKILRSLARPVLVASLSAMIVLGAALAISPDARAAAQEMWVRFVEVDSPWALLPRGAEKPEMERRSDSATVPTPPGTAGDVGAGDASSGRAAAGAPEPSDLESGPAELPVPGVQPTRDLISLEEAQARLDFKIRVPSALPDGYTFRGVVPQPELPTNPPNLGIAPPDDLPKIEQPQVAMLIFGNAADEILILSEKLMTGPTPIEVPLPAGKGGVQNVTVNGQSAQYVEGRWTEDGWVAGGNYQLHWQSEDDIMYDLTSSTLDLETLLPVAESIQ